MSSFLASAGSIPWRKCAQVKALGLGILPELVERDDSPARKRGRFGCCRILVWLEGEETSGLKASKKMFTILKVSNIHDSVCTLRTHSNYKLYWIFQCYCYCRIDLTPHQVSLLYCLPEQCGRIAFIRMRCVEAKQTTLLSCILAMLTKVPGLL